VVITLKPTQRFLEQIVVKEVSPASHGSHLGEGNRFVYVTELGSKLGDRKQNGHPLRHDRSVDVPTDTLVMMVMLLGIVILHKSIAILRYELMNGWRS
jgi:hypothetical protein